MKNQVSVCVPTYNNTLQEFKKTINAILQQNYQKIDIVVSDNYPKNDQKYSYIKKIKKNKKIYYFKHNKYLTIVENWDFVIKKTTTKYIMVCGCGDEISKNYISQAVKFLNKNKDYYGVAGKWMPNYHQKNFIQGDIPIFNYFSDSKLSRISKYLFEFNDNYINAVARTKIYKKISFKKTVKDYWWLNKKVLPNKFTQFLFACLLEGKAKTLEKMLYTHNAPGWPKNQQKINLKRFLIDIILFYLRYFNLFFNFFILSFKKEKKKLPIFFIIIFFSLIYNYYLNTKKFLRKLKNYLFENQNFY